jgi:hypothetical protein
VPASGSVVHALPFTDQARVTEEIDPRSVTLKETLNPLAGPTKPARLESERSVSTIGFRSCVPGVSRNWPYAPP